MSHQTGKILCGILAHLMPVGNNLFVCLFVWCLTAHQHRKAISAKYR